MISAIVLAAGRSTRMGTLKQILPFGALTVIECVLTTLLDTRVDRVVVVLGHRAEEIRRLIARYPVHVVVNPDPEGDMLSSVQCGEQAVTPGHALMIALGDQPLITASIVNALIDTYERDEPGFVIPTYNGKRGHPMIIGPRYRDEIPALHGPGGLKGLRDAHAKAVATLSVEYDDILIDLDYRRDYEDALKRLSEG